MSWLSGVRERLRSLLFRASEEADLDEELRFHLEMETEANMRAGMSPEEASRRARLAFGGMERFREEVRDARGLPWVEIAARDTRYALRGLRLNPVFSGTLVLTLALGIGAMAAMFSIVDALLLRPLPYQEPDRLVEVFAVTPSGDARPYIEWDAARVWHEQSNIFDGAMSHVRTSLLFTGGAEPQMLTAEGVTANFEEVLGVRPMLGRGFYAEDVEPGAPSVVILDHAFWRSAYGADAGVIGSTIELDGDPHRVVGVMPEGFKFPEYATTELWMPIRSDGAFLGRPAGGMYFLGRISQDPLEVVQARADAVAKGLAEEQPREQGWTIQLRSLEEGRAGNAELRQSVWFLAGAVVLLLLAAAVNGTSLLLMRAWARARELAVRLAVGASRRRLVGQLLTESVVLAAVSGVAATLLALVVLRSIRGIMPTSITFFAPYAIEMEWRALGFTFLIAAATGMLIGVVPAMRASRMGSTAGRGSLTPYASRTPAGNRLRRGLIVAEVALSMILLVGAGLLIHSFVRLVRVDPGFTTENLAVMTLNLPRGSYPTSETRAIFLRQLEQRLEAIPGVDGATTASGIPPGTGFSFGVVMEAEGEPPPEVGQPQILPHASVAPDYFEVLRVPITGGRPFTPDDAGTDHVIIDHGLARYLWGDASPVGRRFRTGPDSPWLTVVGLVEDLRMMGPDDRRGSFEILYPRGANAGPSYVPIAIRTRSDPRPFLPAFRSAVHAVDPRQPIEELRSADDLYAESIDMPRFLLVLMSILSGLALLLSVVGIYGVISFGVLQRRRELGIRLALGAPLRHISWGVMREGLLLAGTGVVVGTVIALWLSRLVQGLLYEVEPTDPTTVVVVIACSMGAAALASFWPARRATRLDPVEVLRVE